MTHTPHFTPELFSFLRSLAKNNRRDWFLEHKARYEATVRDPLLRFISDFGPRLHRISPHFIADPRPSGGSMFRIYRDTRFSKNKSPYKTHAAAQFRHQAGKDVHAPGFYLHLSPGEVFAGAGIWRPDSATLLKIRTLISEDPRGWKRAANNRSLKKTCLFGGDSLKRAPKGFDPEHELIEDLKRKDFVVFTQLSEEEACAPGFIDTFAGVCRAASPVVRFLTRAADVSF